MPKHDITERPEDLCATALPLVLDELRAIAGTVYVHDDEAKDKWEATDGVVIEAVGNARDIAMAVLRGLARAGYRTCGVIALALVVAGYAGPSAPTPIPQILARLLAPAETIAC